MSLPSHLALSMPGPTELIIILGILLLFFGPKKLPELARSIGRAINSFKEGISAKPGSDEEEGKGKGAGKSAAAIEPPPRMHSERPHTTPPPPADAPAADDAPGKNPAATGAGQQG